MTDQNESSSVSPLGEYHSDLVRIISEWNLAEQDIKEAEQIVGEAVVPSIKELRYAGRRLLQALETVARGGNAKDAGSLVQDAWFCCHRARHDAIDAATAIIAQFLDNILNKIGYGPVVQAFPKFVEMRKLTREIQTRVASSRSNSESRDKIYSSIELNLFPALVALHRELKESEDVMIQIARREKALYRWGVIGGVVGIISFVGFLIQIILTK